MVYQSTTLGYKVGPLCEVFGYSRQSYYKWLSKQTPDFQDYRGWLIKEAIHIRKELPKCGCRAIYRKLDQSWPYGRDRTERMLLSMGFGVQRIKKYVRTTKAGERFFPNLIYGYQIDDINQVWQSDMTYFYTKDGGEYYLIFIIDVYSQRVVGYGAFDTYPAKVFVTVLNRAVRLRQGTSLVGLIFHSDRGNQFSSKLFVGRLGQLGIISSMAKYSWENPFAEKINDIIKNGFLDPWGVANFKELRKRLKRAVHNYNHYQQIRTLGYKSPVEFEEYNSQLFEHQRETRTLKPTHQYEYQLVKQELKMDMNTNQEL